MKHVEKLERHLSQIVAWAVYHKGKPLFDKDWDELYALLLIKSTILEIDENDPDFIKLEENIGESTRSVSIPKGDRRRRLFWIGKEIRDAWDGQLICMDVDPDRAWKTVYNSFKEEGFEILVFPRHLITAKGGE